MAALFCLICGSKLWLIQTAGNSVPYWDQWDAEANLLIKPLVEGHFPLSQLFAPHNEHRILLTRLLSLGALKLNGLWDPLVLMVIQAFVHSGALCLFLMAAGKGMNRALRAPFLAFGGMLFVIPFGWENTLWGFQSQFYFQILFGLLSLWLAWRHKTLSAGWWLAVAMAGVGLFTMAGGLFAPLVCAGFSLLRAWRAPATWRREGIGAAVMGLLVLAGLALTQQVPGHNMLKASSVGAFLEVLAKICSWPISCEWLAWLVLAPPCLLAWQGLRERNSAHDPRWLLVGLAAWSLLQAAAIAYGRNIGAFASRYADNFTLTLCISFACLLQLRTASSRRARLAMSAAICLWLLVVLAAVIHEASSQAAPGIMLKTAQSIRQEKNIRAYVATGDPIHLAGTPVEEIPYPSRERLRMLLDTPAIAAVLPTKLRRALEPSETRAPSPGFVANGYYPAIPPRDSERVWGSYGAQGDATRGEIELKFAAARQTRSIKLSFAGYPARKDMTFVLIDSAGERHDLGGRNAGERWRSLYLTLPPGPFSVLARDDSDKAWFAFAAPREVGPLSLAAGFLADKGFWLIALGAVLLAGPWFLRAQQDAYGEKDSAPARREGPQC
jgi:hypothetical protein